MDPKAVLTSFDLQMRRDAPGIRDGQVVRQDGAWSGVQWSDLDESTADEAIAAQVKHFGDRPFEWKLYAHDQPADLAQRLLAAGFTAEPQETVMVAEIAALPAEVELPEGVRLEPVTDQRGVDLMVEVHRQAFGSSPSYLSEHILGQVSVLAMAGETPVSAARMELLPGTEFASLWSGGTVRDWRGKGIYRALVAYRGRIAAERGYRYLQVDASADSRPILARLGFAALTTTTPYVRGM